MTCVSADLTAERRLVGIYLNIHTAYRNICAILYSVADFALLGQY